MDAFNKRSRRIIKDYAGDCNFRATKGLIAKFIYDHLKSNQSITSPLLKSQQDNIISIDKTRRLPNGADPRRGETDLLRLLYKEKWDIVEIDEAKLVVKVMEEIRDNSEPTFDLALWGSQFSEQEANSFTNMVGTLPPSWICLLDLLRTGGPLSLVKPVATISACLRTFRVCQGHGFGHETCGIKIRSLGSIMFLNSAKWGAHSAYFMTSTGMTIALLTCIRRSLLEVYDIFSVISDERRIPMKTISSVFLWANEVTKEVGSPGLGVIKKIEPVAGALARFQNNGGPDTSRFNDEIVNDFFTKAEEVGVLESTKEMYQEFCKTPAALISEIGGLNHLLGFPVFGFAQMLDMMIRFEEDIEGELNTDTEWMAVGFLRSRVLVRACKTGPMPTLHLCKNPKPSAVALYNKLKGHNAKFEAESIFAVKGTAAIMRYISVTDCHSDRWLDISAEALMSDTTHSSMPVERYFRLPGNNPTTSNNRSLITLLEKASFTPRHAYILFREGRTPDDGKDLAVFIAKEGENKLRLFTALSDLLKVLCSGAEYYRKTDVLPAFSDCIFIGATDDEVVELLFRMTSSEFSNVDGYDCKEWNRSFVRRVEEIWCIPYDEFNGYHKWGSNPNVKGPFAVLVDAIFSLRSTIFMKDNAYFGSPVMSGVGFHVRNVEGVFQCEWSITDACRTWTFVELHFPDRTVLIAIAGDNQIVAQLFKNGTLDVAQLSKVFSDRYVVFMKEVFHICKHSETFSLSSSAVFLKVQTNDGIQDSVIVRAIGGLSPSSTDYGSSETSIASNINSGIVNLITNKGGILSSVALGSLLSAVTTASFLSSEFTVGKTIKRISNSYMDSMDSLRGKSSFMGGLSTMHVVDILRVGSEDKPTFDLEYEMGAAGGDCEKLKQVAQCLLLHYDMSGQQASVSALANDAFYIPTTAPSERAGILFKRLLMAKFKESPNENYSELSKHKDEVNPLDVMFASSKVIDPSIIAMLGKVFIQEEIREIVTRYHTSGTGPKIIGRNHMDHYMNLATSDFLSSVVYRLYLGDARHSEFNRPRATFEEEQVYDLILKRAPAQEIMKIVRTASFGKPVLGGSLTSTLSILRIHFKEPTYPYDGIVTTITSTGNKATDLDVRGERSMHRHVKKSAASLFPLRVGGPNTSRLQEVLAVASLLKGAERLSDPFMIVDQILELFIGDGNMCSMDILMSLAPVTLPVTPVENNCPRSSTSLPLIPFTNIAHTYIDGLDYFDDPSDYEANLQSLVMCAKNIHYMYVSNHVEATNMYFEFVKEHMHRREQYDLPVVSRADITLGNFPDWKIAAAKMKEVYVEPGLGWDHEINMLSSCEVGYFCSLRECLVSDAQKFLHHGGAGSQFTALVSRSMVRSDVFRHIILDAYSTLSFETIGSQSGNMTIERVTAITSRVSTSIAHVVSSLSNLFDYDTMGVFSRSFGVSPFMTNIVQFEDKTRQQIVLIVLGRLSKVELSSLADVDLFLCAKSKTQDQYRWLHVVRGKKVIHTLETDDNIQMKEVTRDDDFGTQLSRCVVGMFLPRIDFLEDTCLDIATNVSRDWEDSKEPYPGGLLLNISDYNDCQPFRKRLSLMNPEDRMTQHIHGDLDGNIQGHQMLCLLSGIAGLPKNPEILLLGDPSGSVLRAIQCLAPTHIYHTSTSNDNGYSDYDALNYIPPCAYHCQAKTTGLKESMLSGGSIYLENWSSYIPDRSSVSIVLILSTDASERESMETVIWSLGGRLAEESIIILRREHSQNDEFGVEGYVRKRVWLNSSLASSSECFDIFSSSPLTLKNPTLLWFPSNMMQDNPSYKRLSHYETQATSMAATLLPFEYTAGQRVGITSWRIEQKWKGQTGIWQDSSRNKDHQLMLIILGGVLNYNSESTPKELAIKLGEFMETEEDEDKPPWASKDLFDFCESHQAEICKLFTILQATRSLE